MDTVDTRISIYKLEVLYWVVTDASVTKAAARLHVAQPVVTGHIRSLERQLGVRLFDRVGRKLRLTTPGQAAFEWARDVVLRTREAAALIESLTGPAEEIVTVASTTVAATNILPDVVVHFRQRHPDVVIRVQSLSAEGALAAVRSAECDFGVIGYLDTLGVGADLVADWLGNEDLVLVAAPERDDLPDSIDLAQLDLLPFVCTPGGSSRRQAIDTQLGAAGVSTRRIVLEMAHTESIKNAVRGDVGVALLARSSVAPELARGELREIQVRGARLTHSLHLVWRHSHQLTLSQRELVVAVMAAFRELRS